MKQLAGIFFPIVCTGCVILQLISCGQSSKNTVTIYSSQREFALYAELFNISQSKYKVSVVYRENPAKSLPAPAGQEPDIVIGPELKNAGTRKYFIVLDFLFDELKLSRGIFYNQLLELGNISNRQYFLPVSFNLPAVIFDSSYQDLMSDSFMLSLDQIRETGAAYNKKGKNGSYTALGFSPTYDPDFLYVVAKLKSAQFQENRPLVSWNQHALDATVTYLRDWITDANTSYKDEEDFIFKYLYTPVYKSVTAETLLFGYMRSDELFNLPQDRIKNIDFRWVHDNGQIPVADKIVNMGIYHKSKNIEGAQAFIVWFMNEENQRKMLDWILSMNLENTSFGIAGGFSSIKSVNERVFSTVYPLLFGHLPDAEMLKVPNVLPANWETIKQRLIIPFLTDSVKAADASQVVPLSERVAGWARQTN